MLVDTTSPLRPARSTPRALPREVRQAHVVAADISPDGKLLALATEAGNQVMLLDLVPRGRAVLVGSIAVVPEVRESTLVDVAFSPTGDTLWVLSGDTRAQPRDRAAADGAARDSRRERSRRASPTSRSSRVVRIATRCEPARLGVGRALPLASGGAIRLPPERTTVFVAASSRPIVEPPAPDRRTPAGDAPGPTSDPRAARGRGGLPGRRRGRRDGHDRDARTPRVCRI